MTTGTWPLARAGTYRGAILYARCGQGTRRPRDGWFAYLPRDGVTLRAPSRYLLKHIIKERKPSP
jgi:hypothetical protein